MMSTVKSNRTGSDERYLSGDSLWEIIGHDEARNMMNISRSGHPLEKSRIMQTLEYATSNGIYDMEFIKCDQSADLMGGFGGFRFAWLHQFDNEEFLDYLFRTSLDCSIVKMKLEDDDVLNYPYLNVVFKVGVSGPSSVNIDADVISAFLKLSHKVR